MERRTGTLALCARCSRMNDSSVRPLRYLTSEEREAREAARKADAELAMREYEAGQRAFHQNRERLKAERLAREAMRRR